MNDYSTKEQQHKFYKSAAWQGKYGVRLRVLERDNHECQMCKREGKVHLDSVKVKGERKSIQLYYESTLIFPHFVHNLLVRFMNEWCG